VRRSEPGARAEKVAERAATHASLGGERVDLQRAAGTRKHLLPYLGEQRIALWVTARSLAHSLERKREVEEFALDLVTIAPILTKRPLYEPHEARDEWIAGRRSH
jgi:hypothetical protein